MIPTTADIFKNPPLSLAMSFEMKSSVLEGLQSDRHTNFKVKPHKKDRRHGDPNIFAKSSSFPFPNPVVERDERENRSRTVSLQNCSNSDKYGSQWSILSDVSVLWCRLFGIYYHWLLFL